MAQGTGVHRFLAPLAKAASTRAILVLAAAVTFALVGCGGSSSGDDQASTVATSTARTAASAQKSSSPKEGGKQAPSAAEEEQREAAAKVRAEGKQGGGGKHGPTISTPKGEQEPEITPRQREESNVASIALSSPSLPKTGSGPVLPATYTCDGKDSWPALAWSGIPAGSEELALFAMNVQPVDEAIFFDWAVAGLDPSSGGIEAGKLPAGAIQGKNSFGKAGYSICPPKGTNETVIFVLYALPKALGAKQGFDPLALREEASTAAPSSGLYAASYEG